jgi:uncharacterized membrane protein
MTSVIACPATSQLTENDLIALSLVFPRQARSQLIELRRVLSNRNASFRAYESGVVTFDMDSMLHEVALKCSAKTVERVSHLLAHGVCLQAIASAPLKIPMSGAEQISLRF